MVIGDLNDWICNRVIGGGTGAFGKNENDKKIVDFYVQGKMYVRNIFFQDKGYT